MSRSLKIEAFCGVIININDNLNKCLHPGPSLSRLGSIVSKIGTLSISSKFNTTNETIFKDAKNKLGEYLHAN